MNMYGERMTLKGITLVIWALILMSGCSESESFECLSDGDPDQNYTDYAFLEGQISIDSVIFRFEEAEICSPLTTDEIIEKNPFNIYEVEVGNSSNCDCVFIESVSNPYCEYKLEEIIDDTFTGFNSQWFFGYMWDENGEYHPHCDYKDVPDDFKLSSNNFTEEIINGVISNFWLEGKTSFTGEGCWSFAFVMDEELNTVKYLSQGGCQSVPVLPVNAFRNKIVSLFKQGADESETFSYSIKNNQMNWLSPDGNRGFVFYGKKRDQ